ncbi:trypsin-like peptidase domain-containing protein [Nonomuraea sp. NPDC050404]|uniref:trypsin-like peptidase domain-containing protein n=1 Tax=Nonomuraea sp. NPDC050404 TaxID=3155783 RepID=UPI0033C09602
MEQAGTLGGWEALLRAATVALETSAPGGPMLGTGFFVADGIVATCAHVAASRADALPATVSARLVAEGRDLLLRLDPGLWFRDPDTGLDLALLTVVDEGGSSPASVLLSDRAEIGDELWTYGHPDGAFRAGQPATFVYEGASRRSQTDDFPLPRLRGTPVGGGFSGSAVVNRRTGAVCGMLVTSDQAGSAHLISASAIVDRCPRIAADRRWLDTLDDDQLRRGGWRHPGPRLRAYLRAAVRAAESHPYPGVLPGVQPPSLSAVYVRQQVGQKEQEPCPAETVFAGEADAMVVGGPGSGKSSLLRTGVITLAAGWARGEQVPVVPVRVLAADLVASRPIPEAVAASVGAELGGLGVMESWPADFFRAPPLPGVRWLLMVDGLDEIVDPGRRRAVLDKLVGLRHDPAAPYRLLIATRPLPELTDRKDDPARYDLLGLDTRQLQELALAWFGRRGLPEPAESAARLLDVLHRTNTIEVAANPLMATMLCQLFAQDSSGPLPGGRFAVYEAFVGLLRERMESDTTGGVYQQIRASVHRYGERVEEAVARLPGQTVRLMDRLALVKATMEDDRPVLDLLAGWTADLRPEPVTPEHWRSLLRETLRRSGLMFERAGDFAFIHQSIGEYFAVRAVIADPRRAKAAVLTVVNPDWPPYRPYRPGAALVHALTDRWRSWAAYVPTDYRRLAAAALNGRPDLDRQLIRAARTLDGCRFIGDLVADAVLLNPEIIRTATATLDALLDNPALGTLVRANAAAALAGLGEPGLRILLARPQNALSWDDAHFFAAARLIDRGDARGPELMASLTGEHVPFHTRRAAALRLAALGDARGTDRLAEWAAERAQGSHTSRELAKSLTEHDDPRGVELLAAWAADPQRDPYERKDAASDLHELGDPRGVPFLALLALDPDLDHYPRRLVAEALARTGDPRGADVLYSLACDSRLFEWDRCYVAESLAELGDPRGLDALSDLTSRAIFPKWRRTAAAMLARQGDPRGARLAESWLAAPGLNAESRRDLRRALAVYEAKRSVSPD